MPETNPAQYAANAAEQLSLLGRAIEQRPGIDPELLETVAVLIQDVGEVAYEVAQEFQPARRPSLGEAVGELPAPTARAY